MTLPRVVSDETLDALPESDPRAVRSRRDLRRVNRVIGTRGIASRALREMEMPRRTEPLRVLEIGAGDGTQLLDVARVLCGVWPPVALALLDRQDLVEPATIARYARFGWTATSSVVDVLQWAASCTDPLLDGVAGGRWDLIVANLFLHHFDPVRLKALLAAVASRTDRFFACEPLRSRFALAGSHLIGAIGVNAVTREDAVLSVHAGFRDAEISSLWPTGEIGWRLDEYAAGLFSHCFCAERSGPADRTATPATGPR